MKISTYTRIFRGAVFLAACYALPSCSSNSAFVKATIHDDEEWNIKLQRVSDANKGKGYSHPSTISPEQIRKVLQGLIMEDRVPFFSISNVENAARYPVLSPDDSEILSSFLADGLNLADQNEVVTFTRTSRISSWQERVTSGCVFLNGDELNVVLANYKVKQPVKQDIERYQPPIQVRPLNPVGSHPGRLVFDHSEVSREITSSESDFVGMWTGITWHIAVRYKEL